jgi:pimeloyl-ACP methyl ester carboxylesterase
MRAGITPPYILAGHSFGGYNVRLFASFYPQDVAGLVLVDGLHEDQVGGLFQSQLMQELDPQGLVQYLWKPELFSTLPIDIDLLAGLLGFTPSNLQAILDEAAALKESGEELRAAVVRPHLPLVVIHHSRPILDSPLSTPMEQQWETLQRQLASHYRHHIFILAEHSGHNIPREQPALIIEAIHGLLEAR